MTRPAVILMTDFGVRDAYVGTMKGVIHSIAPQATVIDLSHDIARHDIMAAAFHLLTSEAFFASGSIFCTVVDPGVGSARRAIAVECAGKWHVCPDNGILAGLLMRHRPRRAVELSNADFHLPGNAATFHGRDIFAPAAARLAIGLPPEKLGQTIDPDSLRSDACFVAQRRSGGWLAQVLHIDIFGNIISNLPTEQLPAGRGGVVFRIADRTISGLRRSYADVAPGAALAYPGSSGFIEFAVREGNAAREWGVSAGMKIDVILDNN